MRRHVLGTPLVCVRIRLEMQPQFHLTPRPLWLDLEMYRRVRVVQLQDRPHHPPLRMRKLSRQPAHREVLGVEKELPRLQRFASRRRCHAPDCSLPFTFPPRALATLASNVQPHPVRRPLTRFTKIVATLGPASLNAETLRAMIDAGMNVARLNTSHGSLHQHQEAVQLVRECAKECGRTIGVLMDLAGPKLRTGPTEDGRALNLVAGNEILLTPSRVDGTEDLLSIDYPTLLQDVRAGDPILLDDGNVELRVEAVLDGVVECRIRFGGLVLPNRGVAMPESELSMPSLTPHDLDAIKAGVESNVDLFALSFVRSPEDLERARLAITDAGADTPLIAKIERRQAIDHLDAIIAESDGVMVARGDLGVDLPPEEVPVQQRRIIRFAAQHKVPVITATQMLESMIQSPRPTRAEASDVANAVWDLTDAVMLSGETAIGRYPVETIAMMDRIIRRAEANAPVGGNVAAPLGPSDHSYAVALAARAIVDADPSLRSVVCFTNSGYSALLMSKAYPGVPIYAVSPNPAVVNRLALARSVLPILADPVRDVDDMFRTVDDVLIEQGIVVPGSEVLIAGSLPVNLAGTTNFLKVHRVRET